MMHQQPNQQFSNQPQQDPSKSVYVGNIAWRTTEQEIGDTFANFGYVNSVKIITDKETGRSKGFGFVEFADAQILNTVIQQMNGYNLNGRQLRVNAANGGQNRQMGGQGGFNQGGMGMNQGQMGGMPQQMQMAPQPGMNQPMNPGMNQAAMGAAAGGNFMGGGF